MADPLGALAAASYCPVCGCLSPAGVIRCPECSTFHAGTYMEEREAPHIHAGTRHRSKPLLLSGDAGADGESFEESEDIRSWEGGNTDFSFDDEDDPPTKLEDPEEYMRNIPRPEELLED